MKNPHTNETIYPSYIFTDIDGVRFKVRYRSPRAVRAVRNGHRAHCVKFNREYTIRHYLRTWGWANNIEILSKGNRKTKLRCLDCVHLKTKRTEFYIRSVTCAIEEAKNKFGKCKHYKKSRRNESL